MSKLSKNFVGIDISKLWFDAALIRAGDPAQSVHKKFSQNEEGFKKLATWLIQQGALLNDETLFCMEYTGIYNTARVTLQDMMVTLQSTAQQQG